MPFKIGAKMKIKNEYDCLIYLIKCAIHSSVPENIPEEISFEKVLQCGIEHEVANFAFEGVKRMKNPPSPDIMELWEQEYWKGIKRDITQSKMRDEALSALHSHGIYTLEVQGTVVKKYYPQSHLRMMSDIDFILPKEKLAEAGEVMRSIGYETEYHDETEIYAHKGSYLIELHTEFFDDRSVVRSALKSPYSYASLEENFTARVSDTVFYLFHLLHTIKHCAQKGSGIRRVIDLYYLEIAMQGKVDEEYIDGVLKKYGFFDHKEKLLRVKEHWFSENAEDDEAYGDIADFENDIKISGNHGKEELLYQHMFDMDRKLGKHFVKLRHFLGVAFMPKKKIYQRYPFCEKHHYPLLLCWIHRFNAIIFNKDKWKNVKRVLDRLKNTD